MIIISLENNRTALIVPEQKMEGYDSMSNFVSAVLTVCDMKTNLLIGIQVIRKFQKRK